MESKQVNEKTQMIDSKMIEDKSLQKLMSEIKKTYKLQGILGQGGFGTVYAAKNRKTGQKVAIKIINGFQKNVYSVRKILREIIILRKFTEMKDSIFTTKLYDVIIPNGCIKLDEQATDDSEKPEDQYDLSKLTHIGLVMEHCESDFKKILEQEPIMNLEEEHIITMIYNILCAVNFIHTANVIHRDIKPGNILVDQNCNIRIADFGLARCMPQKTDLDKSFNKIQSQVNLKNLNESKKAISKAELSNLLSNSRDEMLAKKRDLTTGVQTRWYRSPEVILTEKSYNQASDIWGVGMVLSELMKASVEYTQPVKGGRILFKGKSCYPISPCQNGGDENEVNLDDQLIKIIEKFPKLKKDLDLSFVSSPDALSYLEEIQKVTKKKGDLASEFNNSSPELTDLLQQMLEFNPYFRPSAKQLLQSKIFDTVRHSTNEGTAPIKVKVKIDRNAEADGYEYGPECEKQKSRFLKLIIKEAMKHKQEKI